MVRIVFTTHCRYLFTATIANGATLADLFREIRDVLDVRVAIDRRSGQPRGFAHADFIDVESAQRAKEHLEKKVIYGRQLRVDFSSSSSMNQGAATTE